MEQGKYRVILADPPWHGVTGRAGKQYRNPKRLDREYHWHYPTVTTQELSSLPIGEAAARDAVLFLWIINDHLPEAPALMRSWGFTYRSVAFAWVKIARSGAIDRRGLGRYTKQNVELCLLGVRGGAARYRKARDVNQVIMAPRREHSRKPDEQYERIMRLFDGPYLELFARQQWPGWDVWGNEAGKFPAQPFLLGEFSA